MASSGAASGIPTQRSAPLLTPFPQFICPWRKRGDQLRGQIVRLLDPRDKGRVCKECSGKRKNKPILGMEIMWELRRDGQEWSGGKILGYLGITLFGRTQVWRRTSAPKSPK